jgi:glycosyltransferase involved in cell wall biosynthesis
MRVLHLYSGNLYGGVENVLVTLARHAGAAPGMEAAFALAFEGRLADELRAAGAEVHVLGAVRLSRPLSVFRARIRLAALLKSGRFDVALAHSPWAMAVFGPAVRRRRVPLGFYMHTLASGDRVERRASRVRPDLALCNSAFTASTLPRIYAGMRPTVVHPPVPPPPALDRASTRAEVRGELGTNPDDVVIVHVARVEPNKGHGQLLRTLGTMSDVPGWTAWLVGGAQRAEDRILLDSLTDLAETAKVVSRVRFVGQRGDVPRLLAAADVYCQPNEAPEAFGVALVEALHAGLPVVSIDGGGAAEIVTPACGVLVPVGDGAALRRALLDLVSDPEMRARLGAAGPARAEEVAGVERQVRLLASALGGIARKADA